MRDKEMREKEMRERERDERDQINQISRLAFVNSYIFDLFKLIVQVDLTIQVKTEKTENT